MDSARAHLLIPRPPLGREAGRVSGSSFLQAQMRLLVALIAGQTVFYGRIPDLAGRVRPFYCLAQERVVTRGLAQCVARKRGPPGLFQRPTRRQLHTR